MLKSQFDYVDFYYNIYKLNSVSKYESHVIKDITFQITEDCNLACSYCYQICKSKNKMSFETAKRLIDYLFDNRLNPKSDFYEEKTHGFVFDFIGGEPFLEIDLIEQICDYFEQRLLEFPNSPWVVNHAYNFSTNGTLYFTPKAQRFMNKYREFLSIGITIDGCKKLHDECRVYKGTNKGSYDEAIKAALVELKQYNNDSTKITIAPSNVSYVAEGLINMIKLGFTFIHANCVFEEGWTLSDAKILYNEMNKVSKYIIENNLQDKIYIALFDTSKYVPIDDEVAEHNWCGVSSQSMIALDYKGLIYPCIRFMESSIGHDLTPFTVGDLDNGLYGTKEYKDRYDIISNLTIKNMSPQKCLDCTVASGCAWCTGYCYQRGDIYHKTLFNCLTQKAQALACKKFYYDIKDWNNYDKINVDKFALEIISQDEWNKFNKKER